MKNQTNIIDIIREAVISDDEPSHKQVYWIEKAYEDGDCDALLIAVCGYSMQTLRDLTKSKNMRTK